MSGEKLTLLDIVPVTAEGILTPEMTQDMTKFLMDTTQVIHKQIPEGSVTIECEYDEVYSAPHVVSLAVEEAEAREIDGVFSNCFGDPGVRALREKLKVPVFGGFEPAIYLGLGLGDTLGIVTVLKNVVPMINGAIVRAGLERRVTSVRTLDMPVIELQDRDKLMANLYIECRKAIEEDGVSVLIMGCTGIIGVTDEMTGRLKADGYDVPVLEAAQCAMTLTELYARMGLYQSRQTYREPPKK
ncbi:MAG: aspartate/glutamate racemase family protein [Oscillospiraceae bacterium]